MRWINFSEMTDNHDNKQSITGYQKFSTFKENMKKKIICSFEDSDIQ